MEDNIMVPTKDTADVIYVTSNVEVPTGSFKRVKVEICASAGDDYTESLNSFKVPLFLLNGAYQVLVKNLARIWNYPSSYQLIKHLVKGTGFNKGEFLRTSDSTINEWLLEKNLIEEQDMKFKLFYIDAKFLFLVVSNKEVLIGDDMPVDDEDNIEVNRRATSLGDDKITISQVFPQYGLVDFSSQLNHSSFNSLTNLTKFNYYKSTPAYQKFLGNSKLFINERELIYREYDYSLIEVLEHERANENQAKDKRRKRKPIGRSKKHNTNVDPNTIDLTESIIPGQGFIQEFNVNHFCRVPNYFVTTNTPNAGSSAAILKDMKKPIGSSSGSSLLFGDNVKLAKNVQQLVFTNESDNYNHAKYYYTKSYRGPGSGNYKDAALISKMNKIPIASNSKAIKTPHKVTKDIAKLNNKRYNANVKGLMHDRFNKPLVDSILNKQREQTDDCVNLEMLHNNLQFNLLLNTYREMADETWTNYYKFKLIDFEQLSVNKKQKVEEKAKQEALELEAQKTGVNFNPQMQNFTLADKFVHPSAHREILLNLPVELRDEDSNDTDSRSIKNPLYYTAIYPDVNNPELLNKVEVVKLPNANAIGWDNMRKYKHD